MVERHLYVRLLDCIGQFHRGVQSAMVDNGVKDEVLVSVWVTVGVH